VELNRGAKQLLALSRRCYIAAVGKGPWHSWDFYTRRNGGDADLETSSHRLLSAVGSELKRAWVHEHSIAMDDLRRAIRSRADTCYQLLWTAARAAKQC
jgi:hypothetical protein